jgi:hypothetical protein
MRRYILGKEIGYDTVKSMSIREFEENWVICNLIAQCSSDEGRKELQTKRGVKKAEKFEISGPNAAPFDPASATPEELDRWIRSQGG